MSKITEKGTLPGGIEAGGKQLRNFTVRPVLVRDTVEAIEDHGEDISELRRRLATEARQITFEGFDGPVTLDMMLDMPDGDYSVIVDALVEVEKKRVAQNGS